MGMRKILAHDAKESTNQGGHFPDFYGLSWSYAGSKTNLHPRKENSSMALLTPKSIYAAAKYFVLTKFFF